MCILLARSEAHVCNVLIDDRQPRTRYVHSGARTLRLASFADNTGGMTRPVTIRLDASDYERLEGEAKRLGIRPGTLAKVLLHRSLRRAGAAPTDAAFAALDRLATVSVGRTTVDVVELVKEARRGLAEHV